LIAESLPGRIGK